MLNVKEKALVGTWWRLNEIEPPGNNIMVWRRDGTEIPVSRGRHSIVLEQNGKCIFQPIGGNDAPRSLPGTWELTNNVIKIRLQTDESYNWKIVKATKTEIRVTYNQDN